MEAGNMQITFLGGGNMSTSIIKGLISNGTSPEKIQVIDINKVARDSLLELGVSTISSLDDMQKTDVIVLGVKPHHLQEAVAGMMKKQSNCLVISVAAGIRTGTLKKWLSNHKRVIRAMPNLPSSIGLGVTGLYAGQGISSDDRTVAENILGVVGQNYWMIEESMLEAVTALSGSGPAYIFYLIEKMEKVGMEMGLDEKTSRSLTIGTFLGSSKLAADSEELPQALRKKVTSKAGTTEKALIEFEQRQLETVIKSGILAAKKRAEEIGDNNDV